MKYQDAFECPVVMVSGNTVQRYYTSARATAQNGFDPYRVLKVCTHSQKKHKGKRFRYASEFETAAYEIMMEVFGKGRDDCAADAERK